MEYAASLAHPVILRLKRLSPHLHMVLSLYSVSYTSFICSASMLFSCSVAEIFITLLDLYYILHNTLIVYIPLSPKERQRRGEASEMESE